MQDFKQVLNKSIFFCYFFIVFLLALFRYDFMFFMPKTTIVAGNSMWRILNNKVFNNNGLTSLSLRYLQESNPDFNFGQIMANEDNTGGYIISVFFNKMKVIGPNGQTILENAALFPSQYLLSHTLQIISYNLVIFAGLFFLYTSLKESNFKISKLVIIDVILLPIFFALALLLVLFAGLLVATTLFYTLIILSRISY